MLIQLTTITNMPTITIAAVIVITLISELCCFPNEAQKAPNF